MQILLSTRKESMKKKTLYKGRYVFSWGKGLGEGWGILVFFPKKVLALPCVLTLGD